MIIKPDKTILCANGQNFDAIIIRPVRDYPDGDGGWRTLPIRVAVDTNDDVELDEGEACSPVYYRIDLRRRGSNRVVPLAFRPTLKAAKKIAGFLAGEPEGFRMV